jgi:lysyl-tRNA synthetase class 2
MSDSPDPFPTASIETLQARSELVQRARAFFLDRGYWEADTPLLSANTVIDAHIDPIAVLVDGTTKFLQTSPELAMKRLLAAGSGSIFQFAHAFRAGEIGHRHNREFTLLEWYKVGANLDELMREVAELTQLLTGLPYLATRSYRDVFREAVGIDPLTTPKSELIHLAQKAGLTFQPQHLDDALNFLWADQVEPTFPKNGLLFIRDYPASQAALAQTHLDTDGIPVAHRFELFAGGFELANGYLELQDPITLEARFNQQNQIRIDRGQKSLPIPRHLIAALQAGLPSCSGVALGFDRVVMLVNGFDSIQKAIPFPDQQA